MKLTNYEIYTIADNLLKEIKNLNIYIPAKANFFIQKNITILVAAAQEIENARNKVAERYGEKHEDGSLNFTEGAAAAANQELNDLFSIEQELDIKKFSIDTLGNVEFTPTQMQALMIMIED